MVMWAEADKIVEPQTPTPVWIKDAHVIAAVPHDLFRNERFELWPFDDRLWVSLCVSPHAAGCVRPKLSELRGDRWIPADELLRGLPPLDAINLWADAKSPFRGLLHEGMTKVTVELDDEFSSFEQRLPLPRFHDTVTWIALPPPYQGEALALDAWTVNGRRVWRVVLEEPTPTQLLLSDRPTQETWTPTPATVQLPTVEKCMRLPE